MHANITAKQNKAGAINMRINELLSETIISTRQIGPYILKIDSHALDRTSERQRVRPMNVDWLIRQIPNHVDQIDQVDDGLFFYIVDKILNTSIGIRKKSKDTLVLMTVLPSSLPYGRGVDTFIYTK